MTDFPRLIEHAFPLKQASLDSVHEKNVRHGHISTLHIWPARRPLAACRAALIATLLPDPSAEPKPAGMSEEQWQREVAMRRQELCEKIGGKIVKKTEKKKMPNGQTVERIKEETEGGILHWGREADNEKTLAWIRELIRKAYPDRSPRVIDPFAGGGAIPLEAIRLGCEATAVDINPVASFIQKCTLEYPQDLAGKLSPLPEFILHYDSFMEEYFSKFKSYSKAETNAAMQRLHQRLERKPRKHRDKDKQINFQFSQSEHCHDSELQADLSWHIRAWGQWVMERARKELSPYYPTYAEFEPLIKEIVAYEHQDMRLVPVQIDGTPDIELLNSEFSDEYLDQKKNPRWIAKPSFAYLWARTIVCKNCRAQVPLLKTLWLCKKPNNRTILKVFADPEQCTIRFGIESSVPVKGGNAAQRREHDKRISEGTMSRAGVKCPCCKAIATMQDIRLEGQAGALGEVLTAVVVETSSGKMFRLPFAGEQAATTLDVLQSSLDDISALLPYGLVSERLSPASTRSISCHLYGIDTFRKAFTNRQLLALSVFAKSIREIGDLPSGDEFRTHCQALLAACFGKLVDYCSVFCIWEPKATEVKHTFARYSFSMAWDFAEANPIANVDRYFKGGISSIAKAVEKLSLPFEGMQKATVVNDSSSRYSKKEYFDVVATDPPYYEAISYSDMSDFFYVWLRRLRYPQFEFAPEHTPKDDEFVQHIREDKNRVAEKQKYEKQMSDAFVRAQDNLTADGRLVIVFAHKDPNAWETLVSAMINAGFTVTASWPIATEMPSRQRGYGVSSLASSVWLVCKKRPVIARPGWDNKVLDEMKANIAVRLREYWDAGIRGPDFVWAATGPAMEAYSKHPVVRKANEPNAVMGVGEFLNHVRRMVVDYVVGQVLSGNDGESNAVEMASVGNLDEVTAYYLLHRHDFGTDEAPVGACILYATACALSDSELERTWDILSGGEQGSTAAEDEIDSDLEEEDDGVAAEPDLDSAGGGKVKLKVWTSRRGKNMGYAAPEGKAVPLIDRIHRLMHLWKDGDLQKVDEYIDEHALRRNELFKRVVQSLIELSTNSERSTLESISNHIGAKGAVRDRGPTFDFGDDE
jgi:putative DNA methylase